MRIDSSGNVGIGTTSPAQPVHLLNGGFAYMRFTSQGYGATGFDIGQHTNGTIYLNNRDNTAMVFMTNNAERMNILAGGEVNMYNTLNINSPSGAGNKGVQIKHSNGNKAAELIHGGTGDEGMLKLYDSNSETVRIAGENNVASFINSGNVGIGLTSVTDKLDVTTSASQYTGSFIYGGTNGSYGALRCTLSASNNPSFIDFFRTSYSSSSPVGAIVTGGSNVLYQSYSDYRLKENVEDLTGALDRVNNLQPKTFNYINAPEFTNEGFIAPTNRGTI